MSDREEFPWHKTPPRGFFFLLTLDPKDAAFRGLQAGRRQLGAQARITATPGIFKGHLGVLFRRR